MTNVCVTACFQLKRACTCAVSVSIAAVAATWLMRQHPYLTPSSTPLPSCPPYFSSPRACSSPQTHTGVCDTCETFDTAVESQTAWLLATLSGRHCHCKTFRSALRQGISVISGYVALVCAINTPRYTQHRTALSNINMPFDGCQSEQASFSDHM